MKTTKRILIAFTALLLLSGCRVKQNTISSNTSQRNDSTVTIIVKDTVVKWKTQLQLIKTNQKSKLSTDFSFSDAWIDSVGLLNHSIQNYPLVPSKIIDKKVLINRYIKIELTKTLTITKKEVAIKTIYKNNAFGWVDWIIGGLLFIYILYSVKINLFYKKAY
jgi:uncharacterized protein YceK